MKFLFNSNKRPCVIVLKVQTKSPERIRVIVKDKDMPFTYYTNRFNTVNGIKTFYIRMPQSPKETIILVYNEKRGDKKKGDDSSFKVVGLEKRQLKTQLSLFDYNNPKIATFLEFATDFCRLAGVLSAKDSMYMSNDGKFRIDYLNQIVSTRTGKPINTPARISSKTGIMQISKAKFQNYTVPMRMFILLHEFSHCYVNENMHSEIEADLHAISIYMGLGYPRIEALQALTEVFSYADTPENRKRHELIRKFINDFDKKVVKLQYI